MLKKKGCDERVIRRLLNLYDQNITIPVVNNVLGKRISNKRGSLRQGDIPSMFWFAIGLDPLLYFLDRRMKGITIFSLPRAGPMPVGLPVTVTSKRQQSTSLCQTQNSDRMAPLQDIFRLCAYADDVKCAITSMHEFNLIISACSLLERAAGVKLHRDITSGKVKFLPLGRWHPPARGLDSPIYQDE